MVFNTRKTRVVLAAIAGMLALLPLIVLAGSTGQIKGRIIDAETGEPVVQASVLILGTTMGNTTDLDGYYLISRVPPGTYTVRMSSVEYKTVDITDVVVSADLTSEQNREVEKKVTELDETITVKGTRDLLDKFQTGTQVNISQETIKHRPVQTVDALLEQVPGVQTTAAGEVFVRGGRAGEVSFIVDGVPIGDPLGGLGQSGANLSLVSGSIQEIQIIKDGFDPEYGNALSGIVNIRSQTGSKDATRFNMQILTDDLGNSDLNEFSRNYDYMRASISGPDPIIADKLFPALGLNFLVDKEFTYYLYGEMEKDDGVFQYTSFDTPETRRDWSSFNLFGFDVPERLRNRYHVQANFKMRPKQNMRVVLSLKKWITRNTKFAWDHRYSSATAPVERQERSAVSLELIQQVSKDMNYEAILSVTNFAYSEKPGDPDNPGRGLDPDDFLLQSDWEDWSDTNRNGIYDAPEPVINLFPDTATFGTNFSGPAYTYGEFYDLDGDGVFDDDALILPNVQGGGIIEGNFRFNNNGVYDLLEGEAFIDLNGNGVWDRGEFLTDKNGNGQLDRYRLSPINTRDDEPFIDGDSILGEPFTDINSNGGYDIGIDIFVISDDENVNQDYNHNGRYDGPEDRWTPKVPYWDRNGNGIYDEPNTVYDPGEPYVDVNGNGEYDFGGSGTFLNSNQHQDTTRWHHREVRTYRGEVKVFRQMGKHEVKGGVALTYEDLIYQEIERPYLPYTGREDGGPYPDRGAFRDFYSFKPWTGTVYMRDKLEYGSMIANLGLRLDFFLQDTDRLADILRSDDRGGIIDGDRHKISPRIGFSYPISDKAKVYFNYGHFFQLPQFMLMYARNTSSVNQNDVIGNPNLDYQKTIQYSFGVKYAMSESYSVDLQGYFKDEFDKINSARIRDGSVFRQAYRNSDYGRSRGVEVTLEKRTGNVSGQVSYTYAFAFGKASKHNEFFLSDFLLSREPLSERALDNDIRHSLKAGIQIYMPRTSKPRLFGFPIPSGWSLTIQSVIESGMPFTPAQSFPDISADGTEDIERNSMRLPSTAVFDARFSKEFELAGVDWEVIFWVENLLDSRNVLGVYSGTGRADTDQNRNQVVFGGTEFSKNPLNWDYGRQIRVGLEMSL
ncbi:MAG TPA: TonB-dependent receptor [Acidobacteriota bacterium]|nr:TonB-dependent receptor [Acidobacteriota bacterium]